MKNAHEQGTGRCRNGVNGSNITSQKYEAWARCREGFGDGERTPPCLVVATSGVKRGGGVGWLHEGQGEIGPEHFATRLSTSPVRWPKQCPRRSSGLGLGHRVLGGVLARKALVPPPDV